MVIINESASIIQPLNPDWYGQRVSAMDMLRLDLLHPVISGNKWYKLKHNLYHAGKEGYKGVLTFGGAHSNHLIATAAAAKAYGMQSTGIVRGVYDTPTPTLTACKEAGMELIFITQEEYKKKNEPDWLQNLKQQFADIFIIPEGGANEWGREGAGEITSLIRDNYTHICISVGTGTTFTGLRNQLDNKQQLLGFVPMKNGAYLKDEVSAYIKDNKNNNWELYDNWHFGGFGKWNDEQLLFMNEFYKENSIPLDIVYTSKMMYGIREMLFADFFTVHAQVLCIHTGGLQGNASVQKDLVY